MDDDPEIAAFLELLFEMEGLGFEVAGSGAALRERMLRPGVDLVLLDVTLPDADGIDLCRQLRNGGAPAELPVIILSARPDPGIEQEALLAGATAFVRKPFENAALLRRIRHALER